jgi:hypothetical protein
MKCRKTCLNVGLFIKRRFGPARLQDLFMAWYSPSERYDHLIVLWAIIKCMMCLDPFPVFADQTVVLCVWLAVMCCIITGHRRANY